MFPERTTSILSQLSLAETLLISKVFHRSIVWEASYSHRKLNHHVICFDTEFDSVNNLPRPARDISSMMQVVFIPQQTDTDTAPSRIPKLTSISRDKCLVALRWLKDNNIAYRNIIMRDDFLLDETYDVPIAETTATDNLQRMIPSHAGHRKTWKVDAEIRT